MDIQPRIARRFWVFTSWLMAMFVWSSRGDATQTLSDIFQVQHWTHAQGLPSDAIQCLLQTRDGSIWIGTRRGLTRYDGRSFYTFNRANVPEMLEEDVLALAEDSTGDLWVSCSKGLLRSSPSGFRRVQIPPEIEKPPAKYLFPSTTGDVWIEGSIPNQSMAVGSQSLRFHDTRTEGFLVGIGAENSRWILDSERNLRLQGNDGVIQRFTVTPLRVGPIFKSTSDQSGNSWFLLGDGNDPIGLKLYQLNGRELRTVLTNAPQNGGRESSLTFDRRGTLWMAAGPAQGLASWSQNQLSFWKFDLSGQEVVARQLLVDRDGALWVGTENSGVYRLATPSVSVLSIADGLPHKAARCVATNERHQLFVGTDAGLAVFQVSSNLPPTWVRTVLSNRSVRALSVGKSGSVWAGTSRGLFEIHDEESVQKRLQTVRTRPASLDPQRLGSIKIRALESMPDGSVWIGAIVHLSLLSPEASQSRVVAFQNSEFQVHETLLDRAGNLWFAEGSWGLGCFSSNALVDLAATVRQQAQLVDEVREEEQRVPEFLSPPTLRWTASNGLSSAVIWDMHEDSQGGLWLATANGLNYLAPLDIPRPDLKTPSTALINPSAVQVHGIRVNHTRAPFVFTSIHGLPENEIVSLVEDELGNLWCGTDRGIFMAPISQFLDVANHRRPSIEPRLLTASDGLRSIEADGRETHRGSCKLADGRVCFATADGLAIVDPLQVGKNGSRPLPEISAVLADGELIQGDLPTVTQALVEGSALSPALRPTSTPILGSSNGSTVLATKASQEPLPKETIQLQPGRGRVLEIRFDSRDYSSAEPSGFRYRLDGLDSSDTWHESQGRRVAHYNNLLPGSYTFQVHAKNHQLLESVHPASVTFRIQPFLWEQTWFRVGVLTLVATLLAWGIQWRITEVRRTTALRSQNELLRERSGIARDLHDGLGAHVTELAQLSGLIRQLPAEKAETTRKRLEELAQEVSRSLRDTVWAATPDADNLRSLVEYMADTFSRQARVANMRFQSAWASDLPKIPLPGHFRRALFLAVQESVTNSIKHSKGTELELHLTRVDTNLIIEIRDNGQGFSKNEVERSPRPKGTGNGLVNQQARIQEIEGTVVCQPHITRGMVTRFEVPIPKDISAIRSSDS